MEETSDNKSKRDIWSINWNLRSLKKCLISGAQFDKKKTRKKTKNRMVFNEDSIIPEGEHSKPDQHIPKSSEQSEASITNLESTKKYAIS